MATELLRAHASLCSFAITFAVNEAIVFPLMKKGKNLIAIQQGLRKIFSVNYNLTVTLYFAGFPGHTINDEPQFLIECVCDIKKETKVIILTAFSL